MNTNLTGMFTLGWDDFGKGLVMAVLGAVLGFIYPLLVSHTPISWELVGYTAATAFVSYLLKNFFSNTQGQFGGIVG